MTARLRSADGRFLLELELRPLADPVHVEWLTYDLRMVDTVANAEGSLRMAADAPLFLQRVIEPEPPMLVAGIRMALVAGQPFSFEPVDERDFSFNLHPCERGAVVRVMYADVPSGDELGWPKGLVVSREALEAFADETEQAFIEVQRCYDT